MNVPAAGAAGFDELYRAEFGRLAGALRLMTGDRMIADEIAQETFIRAWQRWRRVSALDRPSGWLYTTGFRLAARAGRRYHVTRSRTSGELNDGRSSVCAARGAPSLEDAAVERLRFEQALATLPLRQRQAVVARHVLGLSTSDAAVVVGVSADGLRQLLHRGITSLRTSPAFAGDI